MKFVLILLYACLVEQSMWVLGNKYGSLQENEDRVISAESNNGPLKLVDADISLHKPKKDHSSAIKLVNLDQEKGTNSIQDNFSVKLISDIQKITTNLLTNPQTISFLLTLIPTFPPAAIIGSFVMVVLSILQNPTLWQLFQNILPDIKSFANGSNKDRIITKHLKDFSDASAEADSDSLDFVKKGAKYGIKLVDVASKKMNLENLDLDELAAPNHPEPRKKLKSFTKNGKDHRNGKHQKNNDGNPIPLNELQ